MFYKTLLLYLWIYGLKIKVHPKIFCMWKCTCNTSVYFALMFQFTHTSQTICLLKGGMTMCRCWHSNTRAHHSPDITVRALLINQNKDQNKIIEAVVLLQPAQGESTTTPSETIVFISSTVLLVLPLINIVISFTKAVIIFIICQEDGKYNIEFIVSLCSSLLFKYYYWSYPTMLQCLWGAVWNETEVFNLLDAADPKYDNPCVTDPQPKI